MSADGEGREKMALHALPDEAMRRPMAHEVDHLGNIARMNP